MKRWKGKTSEQSSLQEVKVARFERCAADKTVTSEPDSKKGAAGGVY